MENQQLVEYHGQRYLLLDEKNGFVTICNGDYSHFGEPPITVRKEDVEFL